MNSIRRALLIWLTIGITAGIVVAGLLVYSEVKQQADQIFDYQMKKMVASLPVPAALGTGEIHEYNTYHQEDIVIQMWDNTGLRIYRSNIGTNLPQRAELGFSDVQANGAEWRVYSMQIGPAIVQAAQPKSVRSELAAQMALRTVMPLLLLLPILAGLIWIVVGNSLKKVRVAASEVATRGAKSLEPISEQAIPEEILPLTKSLNGLLARLRASISAQRNFVADAAHELKTPLTALKLQLQLAERSQSESERLDAFRDLNSGIDRASHLVQQLLTLARSEPGAAQLNVKEFDLSDLARSTVAEFAAIANQRQIDLGFVDSYPAIIEGDASSIKTVLANLIDNALCYCPPQAKVDVAITFENDSVMLIVSDNGPGIPEQELARIYDRFYRVPGSHGQGSGLGLAIVGQIVEQTGATITMEDNHPGLKVVIRFRQVKV